LKNRTMFKTPSIRKSDASTKVRDVTSERRHTQHWVHDQIATEGQVREPNQQLPDQATRSVRVKGEDQVDDARKNE
jgi:hypothetical protein